MRHLCQSDLPKPETIALYCQRPSPKPPVKTYTPEEKAEVLAFMRHGHGPKETADHFGIPKCTISKWSAAAGIHFPRGNFSKRPKAA